MSLVVSVCCKDFAIFCADQRRQENGVTVDENYRKIFKINEQCMIGIAGDLGDIRLLACEILNIDENPEVVEYIKTRSYDEINNDLRMRFTELKECVEGDMDTEYTDRMRVFVTLNGYDGNAIRLDYYAFEGSRAKEEHFYFPPENVKYVSMNNDNRHTEYFVKRLQEYPAFTMRNIKNSFMDTLDVGIKYDSTINNNPIFEVIKPRRS